MNLALSLLIILALSYTFSFIARRFHSSDVIGLILAGLFLTLSFLKPVTQGHEVLINDLSIAGLFALMFLAGFEVSWNLILKEEKHAIVITIATVISSLLIGTGVMLLLGFSLATSLVMGIAFGITAEAAKARSLLQLKKLKTKIGSLLMGTGIINDVIGMALFVAVLFFYADNFSWDEVFVLLGVLLSFTAGSLVHYYFDRFSKKIRILERFLLITLVPFFFVNMGLHFKEGIAHVDTTILVIVIITAALGQIAGVFITKPITKLRPKQLYLLGWGMNAKGAVELAIAHIALVAGLLPSSLYTSIVIMVLVTSVSFQLVMFYMVRRNPGIMD